MWPPTPPAAYYHDPCSLFYAPRSITTATCPHSSHLIIYNNPTKNDVAPRDEDVHFSLSCMRTQRNTAHALWLPPPKKIISAFLYFTQEARPVLLFITHFFSSHTSHYSQTHFPISQTLSLSLSLKSEKTKNGENGVALCAVCASSFGYRQPTDEQPIQRARARVLRHLPCRFRNLCHHIHSRYLSGFLILCSSFVCVALVVVFNYV